MSERILIVLHQPTSTPGRVGQRLVAKGYRLDIRRPCLGEELPASMDEHAAAIIFGGPMSANDQDDFILREIDWIGVPLRDKAPFLGICLGAQMLAKHLGGCVGCHDQGHVEVGYYPLRATEAGKRLVDWPDYVYQWHREGFDLPDGAVRLAEGDTFPNQAFSYEGTAYALQFHPELTLAMMHRWTVRGAHRLELPNAQSRAQHFEGRARYDGQTIAWLDRFLDMWLSGARWDMRLAAE